MQPARGTKPSARTRRSKKSARMSLSTHSTAVGRRPSQMGITQTRSRVPMFSPQPAMRDLIWHELISSARWPRHQQLQALAAGSLILYPYTQVRRHTPTADEGGELSCRRLTAGPGSVPLPYPYRDRQWLSGHYRGWWGMGGVH